MDVYVDGSCLGNPGPGGAGIVIVDNNKIVEQLSLGDPQTTNNIMELSATIAAIAYVRENYGDCHINIYSDSNYVVKGITEWISGWKKKGWKNVKNLELWKTLDDLNSNCSYFKVPAHSGVEFNELADKLARTAAEEYK